MFYLAVLNNKNIVLYKNWNKENYKQDFRGSQNQPCVEILFLNKQGLTEIYVEER